MVQGTLPFQMRWGKGLFFSTMHVQRALLTKLTNVEYCARQSALTVPLNDSHLEPRECHSDSVLRCSHNNKRSGAGPQLPRALQASSTRPRPREDLGGSVKLSARCGTIRPAVKMGPLRIAIMTIIWILH